MILATITPKGMLPQGPIALGLTHLLKDEPKLLESWRGLTQYKILDNSAFELGSAIDMETVLDVAREIMADEVVLPDDFRKGALTVARTRGALQSMDPEDYERFKFMAVPQGETLEEWLECYNNLVGMVGVDVIAVNRDTAKFFGTRVKMLTYLQENGYVEPSKEYHLLGMEGNIQELRDVKNKFRWVRSIDSCFPRLIAKHNSKCTGEERKHVSSMIINRSEFPETINFDDYVNVKAQEMMRRVLRDIEHWGVKAKY